MQEWGANGEHEALAAPSTLAAQHALAESRQRRDERSLDKGGVLSLNLNPKP